MVHDAALMTPYVGANGLLWVCRVHKARGTSNVMHHLPSNHPPFTPKRLGGKCCGDRECYMSNYRRSYESGGCYFFTVNLHNRNEALLTTHIDVLRSAVRDCKQRAPFMIDAWVVLPDHMHCIWTLPEGDSDYSGRWRRIKKSFTKQLHLNQYDTKDYKSLSRMTRGESGIWQRRFWEHTLRDEQDFINHFHYIHFNPVKHGWVRQVRYWPYSSFHRAVRHNIYHPDWNVCYE